MPGKAESFTERNLTVNFSKTYEKNHTNSITWFELPFTGNTCHLDAMIVDYDSKEVFFIEAKRIKLTRKIKSMCDDIKRIYELYDNKAVELSGRLVNYNDYKYYGVILADVWVENKNNNFKKTIRDAFLNKTFLNNYQQELKNANVPNEFVRANPRYCEAQYVTTITAKELHLLSYVWELT